MTGQEFCRLHQETALSGDELAAKLGRTKQCISVWRSNGVPPQSSIIVRMAMSILVREGTLIRAKRLLREARREISRRGLPIPESLWDLEP